MDFAQQQSVNVQSMIRRNAEEQADFLKDLGRWEESIKRKDAELRNKKKTEVSRNVVDHDTSKRNNVDVVFSKDIGKIILSAMSSEKETDGKAASDLKTSSSFDQVNNNTDSRKFDSSESKPIRQQNEDLETEERRRGNELFRAGDFHGAIKCYTRCLGINSDSAVAFSNRAMAHLKIKDWSKAEEDASAAIQIDPMHVKSYQRRSAARVSLGKLRAALKDIELAKIAASRTSVGISKELRVEERKMKEALRDAVRRAPKRRIPVIIESSCNDEENISVNSEHNESDALNDAPISAAKNINEIDLIRQPSAPKIIQSSNPMEATKAHGKEKYNGKKTKETSNIGKGRKKKWVTPKTWYEFDSIWRTLKNDPEKIQFIESIKPTKFRTIFKNGIEDVDMLVGIIVAASQTKDAADYVRVISSLHALDIVVMMMTDSQRERVRECLLKSLGKDGGGDSGEIASKFKC